MTWLMQEPLMIAALGVVTVAMLFGGLVKTGNKKLIFAILGAVLLFGGLLVAEHFVVTDEESVEKALEQIITDVESGDLDKILAHAVDPSPAEREARTDFRAVDDLQVDVTKIHKIEIDSDAQPTVAEVEFNAVAESALFRQIPFWVRITLHKEGDANWRVYEYEYDRPNRGFTNSR